MTKDNHPITPPPELILDWMTSYSGYEEAARWGADQELEACCEWLQDPDLNVDTYKLRAARRSKTPTKEEALDELCLSFDRGRLKEESFDIIRRALEQLDD
jgi:hypothetical protein